MFPFMNPFQPAICIMSFNVPFKYEYIIVFIVPLKLINTYILFLRNDYSSFANDFHVSL